MKICFTIEYGLFREIRIELFRLCRKWLFLIKLFREDLTSKIDPRPPFHLQLDQQDFPQKSPKVPKVLRKKSKVYFKSNKFRRISRNPKNPTQTSKYLKYFNFKQKNPTKRALRFNTNFKNSKNKSKNSPLNIWPNPRVSDVIAPVIWTQIEHRHPPPPPQNSMA